MKRVSPSIELEARIEELLGAQEAFDSGTLAELGRLGAQLVMQRALVEEVAEDLPALCVHLDHPLRLRKPLRSTNLLERSLGEVRRRV
jgi:uncharacterized coiled-coil protein SlyX